MAKTRYEEIAKIIAVQGERMAISKNLQEGVRQRRA
jgi:hypothetical protein